MVLIISLMYLMSINSSESLIGSYVLNVPLQMALNFRNMYMKFYYSMKLYYFIN